MPTVNVNVNTGPRALPGLANRVVAKVLDQYGTPNLHALPKSLASGADKYSRQEGRHEKYINFAAERDSKSRGSHRDPCRAFVDHRAGDRSGAR